MKYTGKVKVVDGISCYITPVNGDFLIAEVPHEYFSDFGMSDEDRLAHAEHLATCWNEHDTLKAKAELLDELSAVKNTRCCKYLQDGFGVVACPKCQQETFRALLDIEQLLSKAKELSK